jgi:lipopolysaccharide biosynthesis glycosyltransferase
LNTKRLIYTAADSNYYTQAAVLVKSLAMTQQESTHLIVFGNGWDSAKIESLLTFQSELVTVEVRPVEVAELSGINSPGFPLATAYNIIAPKYFLQTDSRAIYVDADVVILDDLGDAWNQKLVTPLAAVIDSHVGFIGFPSMWRPWQEENLNPLAPYLNTGFMVIDLNGWRRDELTEKCLHFLSKYSLPCVDQDALNFALNGEFDHLHPRFNLMPFHLMTKLRTAVVLEPLDEIAQAISSPAMIHYHRSFLGKPWVRGCSHPAMKLWSDLATQVNPKWKRGNDLTGWIKSVVARRGGMTVLDPLSESLRSLKIG